MKINYNLACKTSIASSTIVPATSPKESLFFIHKSLEPSYDISYSSNFDFTPTIYSIKNIKAGVRIEANTSDILVTDVVIDGAPYFYKIISLDGSVLDTDYIKLNTNLDVVQKEGKLYTSSYHTPIQISSNNTILVVPVVDRNDMSFVYKSTAIQITIEGVKDCVVMAKKLEPTFISLNKIKLPSIYVKSGSKTSRLVGGDSVVQNRKEIVTWEGNKATLKNYCKSYNKDLYVLDVHTNTLYRDSYYLTPVKEIVDYTSEASSHIFEFKGIAYFKCTRSGYEVASVSNYDFYIRFKEQPIKVYIQANNNEPYSYLLDTKRYSVGLWNDNPAYQKNLTCRQKAKVLPNPSKRYYVKTANKVIHQYKESFYKPVFEQLLSVNYDDSLIEDVSKIYNREANTSYSWEYV